MTINFKINGIYYKANPTTLPADMTLNTFIREQAQLTATKFMCLEGGCGACVCVIKGKHPATGKMRTWAANSCLTLLNTCADWEITTAEGIGNKNIGYHPIQKRLAKMNGTQCGFCSPGFVMNMYGLLESKGNRVSMKEVENSFGGNICRCTGYRPILDAMKSFAEDSTIKVPQDCQDIEDLCTNTWDMLDDMTGRICLDSCHKPLPKKLSYMDGKQWHWAKNLNEVFQALNEVGNDEYMLVAGNTAHGVYRRSETLKHFIDINDVKELKQYKFTTNTLTLGGALSLTEVMGIFLKAADKPGFEYCQQLWQHFDLIANVPVRNMGTLAGNINIKKMHREFPSDVFITFEALNVQVIVNESVSVQKTMSLMNYLEYDTPKTVLTAFELKAYSNNKYVFNSYKITPRAQNAHAYVNAAFLLDMNSLSGMVNNARICFGGISPEFVHAKSVEALLSGQYLFDPETVSKIFSQLYTVLVPDEVLPDASPEYRKALGCGLFYKFLLSIAPPELVRPEHRQGGKLLMRPLSSGLQTFGTDEKTYPVTQPVQKIEGLIQCTGEATYANDILTTSNSVYCALVTATKVGATIEQIDASEALQQPGVLAFFSAKDIPGSNTIVQTMFVFNVELEDVFCDGRVKFHGHPLGVICALTSDIANHAAKKVKVIYSKHTQVVLPTLEDVLSVNRIMKSNIKSLDISEPSEIRGKGILLIGPQYHFTMEPHTTIAMPFEQGIRVWSSTQWLDQTQCVIAKMLQLKINDVQLKVHRLGGGFGAKITRSNQVACAASLAAYKLNRPARFVQTIESMMGSIGKRWACRSDYEFDIKANGRIVRLLNEFYEDAGCGLNENPIDFFTIPTARNVYDLTESNSTIEGHAVLTDAPSATWCRAPGSLEGVAMMENIIEHIAFEANIDPVDARLVNIKSDHKMAELLPRFVQSTEYHSRRKEINDYNLKNRWQKRGLGLAVMEFPLFYYGVFPATVTIYHADGTVVISHGGIEIGQGINTKIAQVAAFFLGIPLEMIKIEASDTVNGANAIVTGNSVSSESLCFAVRKACETLNERLKPIRTELPANATWEEVVQTAWQLNVNLIASDCVKQGDLQGYKVFGLSLTEMEVDILTGNNQIRRVDILEDAGESLSPYIDIGQIEGAFVMGLGYWLTEQLVYDRRTGELLTNRTWNYKPPGAKDIPIDFRIEVLQNNPNPAGFMRSKTTGEPPACLAVSAMFALRYAIMSARQDAGLKREWLRLGAPTTPENIVLSAGTNILALSLQ